MIRKEKDNKIVYIVVFFLGCLLMYGVIYKYPAILHTNLTKVEKNVTITDNGIAEAVEKVYDAVVVVATYADEKMISSGTGFVYKVNNNDAYILTNNHVIEGGNSVNVTFTNGCNGNLKAISRLVEGEDVDKVIDRLKGVTCGFRETSCGDQFARALE